MRIERSATSLKIIGPPPGLRAPLVTQLVVAGLSASLILYWLRDLPYWGFGFGLYFLYQAAKVFSVSYQPTIIVVEDGLLRITTRGWTGDRIEELELAAGVELSVGRASEQSGERYLFELFPMYQLQIRSDDYRATALRAHDEVMLNAVRDEILAWMQQRPPLRHGSGVSSPGSA